MEPLNSHSSYVLSFDISLQQSLVIFISISQSEMIKLIENILRAFLVQTEFSRDYFQRFLQLLTEAVTCDDRDTLEKIISSIISPLHSSNFVIFEYQLRLIRYALREDFHLVEFERISFLHDLFNHRLVSHSSIFRHLILQIAIFIYEKDRFRSYDEIPLSQILEKFSSDPNLYVRNSLAEFLALYLNQHDPLVSCREIQRESKDVDLIFNLLMLIQPDERQQRLIKDLNIYDYLSDSPIQRHFVLKTAKFLDEEEAILFYLHRLLDKSLSDYVHCLFAVVSSRVENQRTVKKFIACVKALFLFMEQDDIEEIDDNEEEVMVDDDDQVTEFLCCRLFELEHSSMDVASIVLDALQSYHSLFHRFDFYSSTIERMLRSPVTNEKTYAQLIRCYQFFSTNSLNEIIFHRVTEQKRSTILYQSFFDYLLARRISLERIFPIVEILLFEDEKNEDPLNNKDCALQFLIKFIENKPNEFPSWLSTSFLQRLMEKFVHHTNEYIQSNLIDLFARLVQDDFLSPLDIYLHSNLIHLTECSLGDVVRCALARTWLILDHKVREDGKEIYRFSFGSNSNVEDLRKNLVTQIPLLIGDGGQETEMECLRLIESIGWKESSLRNVLDFLIHDGSTEEIKSHARRLINLSNGHSKKNSTEIFEEEFRSILHWLEHPDEHLILDCD